MKAYWIISSSVQNVLGNFSSWSLLAIDHFAVVCLVAWPLNEGKAGVGLGLKETSLPLLC